MNNLQHVVKDNTRFAMHMAVELCEQGDFDSVPEAFRWLNQETVGSYTRWHELFGTPERAARTMEAIAASCQNDDCAACPNRANESCALLSNEGELLEWLSGDA